MTADEAIKRIRNHMEVHRIGQYPHVLIGEAFDAAIAALQEKAEREDPKPLTIEELHNMIGEPVYIVGRFSSRWEIFVGYNDCSIWNETQIFYSTLRYGDLWVAYRHKPKEGQK